MFVLVLIYTVVGRCVFLIKWCLIEFFIWTNAKKYFASIEVLVPVSRGHWPLGGAVEQVRPAKSGTCHGCGKEVRTDQSTKRGGLTFHVTSPKVERQQSVFVPLDCDTAEVDGA